MPTRCCPATSGVMATAKRLKKCVVPWMRPRSDRGNHSCMPRLATGKAPASPMPRRSARRTATHADGDAGHGCRHGPPRHDDGQHLSGAEAISQPSRRDLAHRIGPGERSQHQAHGALAQAELLGDFRLRDGNVAAIHVADQVHQADQEQDPPAGFGGLGTHAVGSDCGELRRRLRGECPRAP